MLAWLLWNISAALACQSTVIGEPPVTGDALAWPAYDPGPTDTVIVLAHTGDDGPVAPAVVFDPAGVEVPVTRYDLLSVDGSQWAVLVPDAPLAPGDAYRVETAAYRSFEFDVSDGVAEVGEPPVPVTRDIQSEVTWKQNECPDETYTVTEVRYRVCDPAPLTVVAVGDTEPPEPTLDALGDVLLVSGDTFSWVDALAPGWVGTLWIGGFDAAGRFTGWSSDALELPPAGTRTFERAQGAEGGATTTPETFSSCPDPVTWNLEFSGVCDAWSRVTRDCLEPEPEEEPGAAGCGCTSTRALPAEWLLVGLLALRRRR